MKPRRAAPLVVIHGLKPYEQVRDESARTQRTLLEAELGIAATVADMAKHRYEHGDSQDGDRCKGEAENAIKVVRYLIATTDLLSRAQIDVLARRCDEVERMVSKVKPAK